MNRIRRLIPREAPLPDAVYRDLVAMLFSMRLPVLGLGIAYVVVGAMIADHWRDPIIAALAAAGVLVTIGRGAVIHFYRKLSPSSLTRAELEAWERRYAIGNYAFAVLLAGLNVQVLRYHEPLMHMVAVSVVFGFGAGIVSRISMRPLVCVASLVLATVPTVVALVAHALTRSNIPMHASLFAAEAVMIGGITFLSLETVRYLYRAVVRSVTVKHDLTFLARQDDLTGLSNRLQLRERFQQSVRPLGEAQRQLALHFLDLDGFKSVNDQYGHPAGDALLQAVGQRLTRMVRAEDTVARLGGDEFVVVQASIEHPSEAEMLARRIIKQVSAPYEIGGIMMTVSVSIGIALAPDQGLDFDRLAACADAALYRSKAGGKGQFQFCTGDEAQADVPAVALGA